MAVLNKRFFLSFLVQRRDNEMDSSSNTRKTVKPAWSYTTTNVCYLYTIYNSPASCKMGTGGSYPGGKADPSPPSSTYVKNAWNYIFLPTIRLHVVMLNQARDTYSRCGT